MTAQSAPGAPEAGASGLQGSRHPYCELLRVDFEGIFRVNVASSEERLKVLRLSMTLLAAPFVATVTLVSAGVISSDSLARWDTIPDYLFGILFVFGLLNVIPFLRFIEVSGTHMRTARAINNFRYLYSVAMHEEFQALGWTPNLPVDARYPATYAPLSWTGINVAALSLFSSAYIAAGALGLGEGEPSVYSVIVLTIVTSVILYLLYYIRSNVRVEGAAPANILAFSRVET